MWVRKSNNELKNKKQYSLPYIYIIAFVVFFLLILLFSKINGNWHRFQLGDAPGSLSWVEIIKYIPQYLFTSALLTIAMFLIVRYIDKNDKSNKNKFICDRCNRFAEEKGICKCGGEFINIELMEWIDDK